MKYEEGLFNVRKTTDERLFTSRVMAEVRARQPERGRWTAFLRWATPALVLSMATFTVALNYSLDPVEASAEALLEQDYEIELSGNWITSPLDEDPLLNSVVNS